MNNRIRELRKALNLSQKSFGAKIGLKQGAISHIEKDGSTVTEYNIKTICNQFHVNEDWLRPGTGTMFLDDTRRQKEFFSLFDTLHPALQEHLIETAKSLRKAQYKIQTPNKK